jgi:hypothetical protein
MESVTNILIDLPDVVVNDVLINWLVLKNVGRLDSAMCSSHLRGQLIRVLGSDAFIVRMEEATPHPNTYLCWHIKRKVKVYWLTLPEGAEELTMTQFITTVGGNHVQICDISGIQKSMTTLLALIATTCRKIRQIAFLDGGNTFGLDAVLRGSWQALHTISIDGCNVMSSTELTNLQLPQLRKLQLVDFKLRAAVVRKFLASSVCLETVRIRRALVDEACLLELCNSASTLHHLALTDCAILPISSLETVAKACCKLRRLDLHAARSVAEVGSTAFLMHCAQLESISLTGSLTNVSLALIAQHCGARLRHLALNAVECSDDSALILLSERCHNIESLSLAISGVSSAALARAIAAQMNLCEVRLRCGVVDDTVLEAVATQHATLQHLDLSKATGFSVAALAKLARQCNCMQSVRVDLENALVTEAVCCFWREMHPNVVVQGDSAHTAVWDEFYFDRTV